MLLIIEDNFDLVNLYRMAMKLVNITPDIEMTGPAALRRIEDRSTQTPCAVILDLHLKKEAGVEVSGEDLFNTMRKIWPATKIIVVSADIAWCARFRGVADAVVEKPIVNMGEFLSMIQYFVSGGQPGSLQNYYVG